MRDPEPCRIKHTEVLNTNRLVFILLSLLIVLMVIKLQADLDLL